jgi:hypothetical protein
MIAVKAYGSESSTVVRSRSEGSRAELLHIERIINEKYFDPKAVRETRFYLSQDGSFFGFNN